MEIMAKIVLHKECGCYVVLYIYIYTQGAWGSVVVKALRY